MATLNTNPDTVCRLVELAREFHAQEAVSFPQQPDTSIDDWGAQILARHSGDVSFDEFKSIIDDLDPDQQQAVVALLWLGRGDYAEQEWEVALAEARYNWNTRTAQYLIAHPLLADYLLEGLNMLGYQCE